MLGAIFLLIVITLSYCSHRNMLSQNRNSKINSMKDDSERSQNNKVQLRTYYAYRHGRYGSYTYDNKQVELKTDKNGDCLQVDFKTGKPIRNLTEEQKLINYHKNINECKQNREERIAVSTGMSGKTFCYYDNFGFPVYVKRGIEYRVVETGEKCYIVRFTLEKRRVEFYMNEDGKLISPSDREIKKNKVSSIDYDDFIKEFNSFQIKGESSWYAENEKFDKNSYIDWCLYYCAR